jgi:hypothetical protein
MISVLTGIITTMLVLTLLLESELIHESLRCPILLSVIHYEPEQIWSRNQNVLRKR